MYFFLHELGNPGHAVLRAHEETICCAPKPMGQSHKFLLWVKDKARGLGTSSRLQCWALLAIFCISHYTRDIIFFYYLFYGLIVYKKIDRAFNYEMDLMFYNKSCMQYIASGALLTTHINGTNEKTQTKQCNREDVVQEEGDIQCYESFPDNILTSPSESYGSELCLSTDECNMSCQRTRKNLCLAVLFPNHLI